MTIKNKIYPFCAIVGQEDMKNALILNVINPSIGGLLIRGEKGTAKSTAVRSLANVLLDRREVANCKFQCDPDDDTYQCDCCRKNKSNEVVSGRMRVIDLPVSATEDRVVGTLDIEHALKFGEKRFESGILASANRNILYVDEVNLLDDHIVDVLLDSAAMGVNTIEREGVSYSHPSKFILVGTMNPEEGDLRPQLIDRFGLVVDVVSEKSTDKRVEIVKNRIAFESNADSFYLEYKDKEEKLRKKIESAKSLLPQVRYSDRCLHLVATITTFLEVDGHRADITMIKTAITNASFENRTQINKEDILLASKLVLPHRMRRKPFEESVVDLDSVRKIIDEYGEV